MLEIPAHKYISAWYTDANTDNRLTMRDALDEGFPLRVSFSPGDGTRYEIMLVKEPGLVGVSAKESPTLGRYDSDVLYATILNGLGEGVGAFNRLDSDGDRDYIMERIRHRIRDKMTVGNPHTVEALAATIFALWYMDD